MKNVYLTAETASSKYRKTSVNHQPLYTLAELATEFGVSAKSLAGLVARTDAPKAVLGRSSYSGPKYRLYEMRKWWSNRNGWAKLKAIAALPVTRDDE